MEEARLVNVHEAKTHLSHLLEEAQNSQEIRPGQSKKRPLGFVDGQVDAAFFEPLPAEELAAFEIELS